MLGVYKCRSLRLARLLSILLVILMGVSYLILLSSILDCPFLKRLSVSRVLITCILWTPDVG